MTMLRSKRDFGTLDTEAIVDTGLAALNAARSQLEKSDALAAVIISAFDNYYTRSLRIPWLAKGAFEKRAWKQAIELSQERIAIFSVSLSKLVPLLEQVVHGGDRADRDVIWSRIEARFRAHMAGRYEADYAFAYLAAIRRALFHQLWAPLLAETAPPPTPAADIVRVIPVAETVTPEAVQRILAVPAIAAPFRDLPGDADLVARRINDELRIGPDRKLERIEIIDAGFYRNRGAYIVGAITVAGETGPLALALLNREHGVEVDAVILRRSTLTHVFSSTLANFHVTLNRYHELADYLFKLMPSRPRGLQYTTIGYNHLGKVTVMRQITEALDTDRRPLEHARGPRGSVAIAFTSPQVDVVLKVIRDRPAPSYKWAHFAGPESVLAKYHRVHELNRSGSMLDNIIYSDIALPRRLFGDELLHDLAQHAAGCVRIEHDQAVFRHLIVQRKVVPLPIYLQSCAPAEAEMAVIRLGQCIRNNAAMNVFNRDLDGRNYGVSSLRFVYLFDYDALEELTQVKVRTNADREPGEEDPPDWFFEEGEIFLPEELELHLKLPTSGLRRLFREAHGELLTAAYWRRMQSWLKEGRVPRVRTYPRGTQLRLEAPEPNLSLIFPS
jgi:isocitrate dehydrogenase kinase/phosphatase